MMTGELLAAFNNRRPGRERRAGDRLDRRHVTPDRGRSGEVKGRGFPNSRQKTPFHCRQSAPRNALMFNEHNRRCCALMQCRRPA